MIGIITELLMVSLVLSVAFLSLSALIKEPKKPDEKQNKDKEQLSDPSFDPLSQILIKRDRKTKIKNKETIEYEKTHNIKSDFN